MEAACDAVDGRIQPISRRWFTCLRHSSSSPIDHRRIGRERGIGAVPVLMWSSNSSPRSGGRPGGGPARTSANSSARASNAGSGGAASEGAERRSTSAMRKCPVSRSVPSGSSSGPSAKNADAGAASGRVGWSSTAKKGFEKPVEDRAGGTHRGTGAGVMPVAAAAMAGAARDASRRCNARLPMTAAADGARPASGRATSRSTRRPEVHPASAQKETWASA